MKHLICIIFGHKIWGPFGPSMFCDRCSKALDFMEAYREKWAKEKRQP